MTIFAHNTSLNPGRLNKLITTAARGAAVSSFAVTSVSACNMITLARAERAEGYMSEFESNALRVSNICEDLGNCQRTKID